MVPNAASGGRAPDCDVKWTHDVDRSYRMTEAWRTGMIWVNCFFERDLRLSFGGERASDIGREGGMHSRAFFTEPRAVVAKRR